MMGEGSAFNAALIPIVGATSSVKKTDTQIASKNVRLCKDPIVMEDRGSTKKHGKEQAMEIEEEGQVVLINKTTLKNSRGQIVKQSTTLWKTKCQVVGRLKRTSSTKEEKQTQGSRSSQKSSLQSEELPKAKEGSEQVVIRGIERWNPWGGDKGQSSKETIDPVGNSGDQPHVVSVVGDIPESPLGQDNIIEVNIQTAPQTERLIQRRKNITVRKKPNSLEVIQERTLPLQPIEEAADWWKTKWLLQTRVEEAWEDVVCVVGMQETKMKLDGIYTGACEDTVHGEDILSLLDAIPLCEFVVCH
ncbi:phosphate acetyltransferase [Striga asiatica]|uniref:Phosphate acetyltransferase n=1 Tax=Striga asiatica TaxID=4170 RepID=A0A5A7RBF4_STRAF|nr:phosphate acetyltransferase [Striga asiatica]